MSVRHVLSLVAGITLAGGLNVSEAQEPVAASADSAVQGYAPVTPAPTAAEPATPAAAPAVMPTSREAIGAQLGFIDVLPWRSLQRIRADENDARTDLAEAEAELAYGTEQKEKTKGMVEAKKQEISSIDAKRKLADRSKQEAEKVAFEAEKKDAERHKRFLERRISLHEAEIDRARAAKKLAEATLRALELETELVSRRGERAGVAGTDPAATRRQDAVILVLEGRVLEAERSQAEAQKQLADKDVDIARRRLELHKAQVAAAGR